MRSSSAITRRPPRRYVFGARDRCDETVFRFRTIRDARYRYIRNFTPERPFLQTNEYKERSYPVWNLIKELAAQGKLTPVQDVLAAPHMPPEELYDVVDDPYEIHNLADSSVPEHQAARQRLSAALERWIEESNDQGRTPEPPPSPPPREQRAGLPTRGAGPVRRRKPRGRARIRRPRRHRPNLPGRSRA